YLRNRNLVDEDAPFAIEYCGGGVSGTVAFVQGGPRQMIVKQALARLRVKETWLCDPDRMRIEMLANEMYHRLVPENVPAVYFYDHENFLFGREAAPDRCSMWKADLLAGKLDYLVAEKVIHSLVTVHNHCARNVRVHDTFADKTIFHDLRISPYLEFMAAKDARIAAYAAPVIATLMAAAITLVHGDFSPKNIMVDGQRVYLLDFEVAHYGHPAFDLAFFANHFLLKSVKNRRWNFAYLGMLRHLLDRYFDAMDFMDGTDLEATFVRLLALLFLARVDGKSPVEYITEEADKELIRRVAFELMDHDITSRREMLDLVATRTGTAVG
ncbi:MAG: phosphotransferase, partial [Planctomycetes bacterium]|nr:phosphotransferase [Planctomycetota bacterium]